jgi:hypothetical protein
MSFSAQELQNIAAAALDFYMKGKPLSQTIQDKPLLKAMYEGSDKTFPGGKETVRRNVKGIYSTQMQGYDTDDVVSFTNPSNMVQINFPWKELHAGITMTMTELKKDGISVDDSMTGKNTSQHSDAELTQISSLLADKLEDMTEGVSRSMNSIGWLDGTQDPKVYPGVRAFIVENPTTGVVAGLDRATNTWWRNRAMTALTPGGGIIQTSPANQTLSQFLRREVRQLKRYGGKPTLLLAGSSFLNSLETEVSQKGIYTQEGFLKKGSTDIGLADISMRGVGQFEYDPTLDDLGFPDYCYFIDPKRLYMMKMEGEDMKKHYPARPHDQYVIFQGVTFTGMVVTEQLNCHGVYQAA